MLKNNPINDDNIISRENVSGPIGININIHKITKGNIVTIRINKKISFCEITIYPSIKPPYS